MENKDFFNESVSVLPKRLCDAVCLAASKINGSIYEIRLYSGRAVSLTSSMGIVYVTADGFITNRAENAICPTAEETENTVLRAAGWSPFAHENEIKQGFITFGRGVRLSFGGISDKGTATVKGVTSVNIRVPHAPPSLATDGTGGGLSGLSHGLLLAGEPGSGKTTMLKKAAAELAENGHRVCVIDERRELYGRDSELLPPASIDVISGCDKEYGILRALRLMSPEYIICDEIGTFGESKAIKSCLNSGVRFIASMHAGGLGQLVRRRQFTLLFNDGVFDRVVFLDRSRPGKIVAEYSFTEVKYAIYGTDDDMCADGDVGNSLCHGNTKTGKFVSCVV